MPAKRWNGATWNSGSPYAWSGLHWQDGQLWAWDGSKWVCDRLTKVFSQASLDNLVNAYVHGTTNYIIPWRSPSHGICLGHDPVTHGVVALRIPAVAVDHGSNVVGAILSLNIDSASAYNNYQLNLSVSAYDGIAPSLPSTCDDFVNTIGVKTYGNATKLIIIGNNEVDVTDILSHIVNLDGWFSGNDIVFYLYAGTYPSLNFMSNDQSVYYMAESAENSLIITIE